MCGNGNLQAPVLFFLLSGRLFLWLPEVPDTPKDTETPDTPSTVTKTSDSPKTGDNTNIYAYLAMLGLSCVGLGGMFYFKRRRKKS